MLHLVQQYGIRVTPPLPLPPRFALKGPHAQQRASLSPPPRALLASSSTVVSASQSLHVSRSSSRKRPPHYDDDDEDGDDDGDDDDADDDGIVQQQPPAPRVKHSEVPTTLPEPSHLPFQLNASHLPPGDLSHALENECKALLRVKLGNKEEYQNFRTVLRKLRRMASGVMAQAVLVVRRVATLALGSSNPFVHRKSGFQVREMPAESGTDLINVVLAHWATNSRCWGGYECERERLGANLLKLAHLVTTSPAASAVLKRAAIDHVVESLNDPRLEDLRIEVQGLIIEATNLTWPFAVEMYTAIGEVEGALEAAMLEERGTRSTARIFLAGFGRYALLQAPRRPALANALKKTRAVEIKEESARVARKDALLLKKSVTRARATADGIVRVSAMMSITDPLAHAERIQLNRAANEATSVRMKAENAEKRKVKRGAEKKKKEDKKKRADEKAALFAKDDAERSGSDFSWGSSGADSDDEEEEGVRKIERIQTIPRHLNQACFKDAEIAGTAMKCIDATSRSFSKEAHVSSALFSCFLMDCLDKPDLRLSFPLDSVKDASQHFYDAAVCGRPGTPMNALLMSRPYYKFYAGTLIPLLQQSGIELERGPRERGDQQTILQYSKMTTGRVIESLVNTPVHGVQGRLRLNLRTSLANALNVAITARLLPEALLTSLKKAPMKAITMLAMHAANAVLGVTAVKDAEERDSDIVVTAEQQTLLALPCVQHVIRRYRDELYASPAASNSASSNSSSSNSSSSSASSSSPDAPWAHLLEQPLPAAPGDLPHPDASARAAYRKHYLGKGRGNLFGGQEALRYRLKANGAIRGLRFKRYLLNERAAWLAAREDVTQRSKAADFLERLINPAAPLEEGGVDDSFAPDAEGDDKKQWEEDATREVRGGEGEEFFVVPAPGLFHFVSLLRLERLHAFFNDSHIHELPICEARSERPKCLDDLFNRVLPAHALRPASQLTSNGLHISISYKVSRPPARPLAAKVDPMVGKGKGDKFKGAATKEVREEEMLRQREVINTPPPKTPDQRRGSDKISWCGLDLGVKNLAASGGVDSSNRPTTRTLTGRAYRDGAHFGSHKRRRRKWSLGIRECMLALAAGNDCGHTFLLQVGYLALLSQCYEEIMEERLKPRWAIARFRAHLSAKQVLQRYATAVIGGDPRHGTKGRPVRLAIGNGFKGGRGAPTQAVISALFGAAASGAPSWGGGAADGSPRKHLCFFVGEWGTSLNCCGCGQRNGEVTAAAIDVVCTREIYARWEADARATRRAVAGLPVEKPRKQRNLALRPLHGVFRCPNPRCPFFGQYRERDGGSAQSIRGNGISISRTGQLQRRFRQGAAKLPAPPQHVLRTRGATRQWE